MGRHDGYLQAIGIALWLMKKDRQAADVWLSLVQDFDAGKIDYSDGAGGVENGHLLWFASCHPVANEHRATALRYLRKRCKSRIVTNWPGPIAKYLVGSISEKALLTAAEADRDDPSIPEENYRSIESRQLCQAYFYIGVRAFETGDMRRFKECMRKSVSLGSETLIENEFYLAQREQRRR